MSKNTHFLPSYSEDCGYMGSGLVIHRNLMKRTQVYSLHTVHLSYIFLFWICNMLPGGISYLVTLKYAKEISVESLGLDVTKEILYYTYTCSQKL